MLQEMKNARGGGRSKTQEIGQTSDKTIHNNLTCDKLNDNANTTKDISNIDDLSLGTKLNKRKKCDKSFNTEALINKIDNINYDSYASTMGIGEKIRKKSITKTTLLIVSWLFVVILSIFVICSANANSNTNKLNTSNNAMAVGSTADNETTATKFAGGSGTESDPYQIATPMQLRLLSTDSSYWSNSFIQTADITYITDSWNPIGNVTTKFTGNYDGGGHTITFDKTIRIETTEDVGGLFGYVNYANVENVIVDWAGTNILSIENDSYIGLITYSKSTLCIVGGIVATGFCNITNCATYGTINAVLGMGVSYAGGISGQNWLVIKNCCNNAQVNAYAISYAFAAGIAREGIEIINCYNKGNIYAESSDEISFAGGITAEMFRGNNTINIRNCYNIGAIKSLGSSYYASEYSEDGYAGGLCSYLASTSSLTNCFSLFQSASSISITGGYKGGLVGGGNPTINSCYYNYPTSSESLKTTELKNIVTNKSNYLNSSYWNLSSPWDFTNTWEINSSVNDGYPYLRAIEEYHITYTAGEGTGDEKLIYYGLKSSSPQVILKNISDLNYTAPDEMIFDCWVDESGQTYQSGQEVTMTENLVLTAQWKVNAYTVTFDITTNGGSGNAPTAQTVNAGESTALPTGGYKSGWTFVGWSTDETSTISNILNGSYTPTSSVTLYAIFSKTLTANFYQLGGANDAETIIIYNNETSGQITAPTISTSGVTGSPQVVGWAKDSNTSTTSNLAPETSTTISGNVNYYAVVSYTVTVSYSGNGHTGGSAVASSTGTAYKTASGNSTPNITKANITIAQNTFTKDNYTFIGWASTQGATTSEYSANTAYPFDSNTTLYAVWQSNYVGVTFNITTNVGVIFNVYDNLGNFVQQMYVAKGSGQQTISTQLLKGKTYTIIMSANYTTNIVSVSGATQQGRELLMTISDSGNTVTIQVTGFSSGNGIII